MPANPILLGIDLGAGSLKATVIDAAGATLGEGAHPIATAAPRPGWSEQDPEDWYRALCQAVPAALAAAGVAAKDLAGIGISAGAHIPVLLDADDRVLRPAILWSDLRSRAEAEALHAEAGELIVARSLNKANATWSLPMLKWLQTHEPETVAKVSRLCIAKDYLRFRLTGDWHSDFSDAVGALIGDVETRDWSDALCALIDWPRETLPPMAAPTDVVGRVTADAASATGLAAGLPVVCGSNDTTVEILGAGAVSAGQGAIKLATAGVVFLVTDGAEVHPPISCYPHILPGKYYMASGTNACASAHRWLRDRFFAPLDPQTGQPLPGEARPDGIDGDTFAMMDRLANGVPPGCEGLLFHPYLQGERAPHWDPQLRADFLGLTFRHGRGHMVRALYEGIAFALRDCLESFDASGQRFEEIRLIGGGARSALWRRIIADVMGLEILQPGNGDASFGAALLAGVGVGAFASPEDAVARCTRVVSRDRPDPANRALYDRLFALYRDSQARLAPIDHALHDLFAP